MKEYVKMNEKIIIICYKVTVKKKSTLYKFTIIAFVSILLVDIILNGQ